MPKFEKGFIQFLPLLLIFLGIIAGIYLVSNPQIFKSNAALDKTRIEFVDDKGSIISQTSSPKVKIRLVFIPQTKPSPSPSATPVPTKIPIPTLQPTPAPSPSPTSSPSTTPKPSTVVTCKGESRTWDQMDSDLKGANYPGPYNHSQAELDAYNRAACPTKQSFNLIPSAYAIASGGKECVYAEGPSCHLGNCLDGSQNCSTNVNCGYVPGFSSGKTVDCKYGGAACVYTENGTCHQGNCLDGSQNCSFNVNCGYVSGYSSGKTVDCPGASSSPSSGFGLKVFNLGTEFGMQIDEQDSKKVPTADQLNALKPTWVRFVYRPEVGLLPMPSSVKQLVIFNNESATPAPVGSTDLNVWKTYTDSTYVPALKNFLTKYPNISAVEIWNEEDICPSSAFCPKVPPAAYSYLIKHAAAAVKAQSSSVRVVMGGLASGQPSYITQVVTSPTYPLGQVDAIGIHPYGQSPTGALQNILGQYQSVAGSIPIWVSEVGLGSNDQNAQADYLNKSFNVYSMYGIPVVIWYAWIDTMTGGDGANNYGLVNSSYNLKLSGKAFLQLNQGGPVDVYPTGFRVANTKDSLYKAKEQLFSQNKVLDWTLDSTPGLKTVYAQFKVNGIWGDPVYESITLKNAPPLKYDLNGDGRVNKADYDIFMAIWRSGKYSSVADFNSDKRVNIFDQILIYKATH